MRYTCLSVSLAMLFMLAFSCKEKPSLHDFSSEGARMSAESLLMQMKDSDVVSLVGNMDDMFLEDSAMREQMYAMTAQFLDMQYSRHGGIGSAVATRDTIIDSTAIVLLNVTYGDKTTEQVLVHMVYRNGNWKMR